MKVVKVSESKFGKLGSYQREVLECGHRPGVLSGASLQGKAKQYAYRYAQSRNVVESRLFEFEVSSKLVLIPSEANPKVRRWSRVWVDDLTDEPVRVVLN